MNVLRGTINQSKENRRPYFKKNRFTCPPVFETIRSRISPTGSLKSVYRRNNNEIRNGGESILSKTSNNEIQQNVATEKSCTLSTTEKSYPEYILAGRTNDKNCFKGIHKDGNDDFVTTPSVNENDSILNFEMNFINDIKQNNNKNVFINPVFKSISTPFSNTLTSSTEIDNNNNINPTNNINFINEITKHEFHKNTNIIHNEHLSDILSNDQNLNSSKRKQSKTIEDQYNIKKRKDIFNFDKNSDNEKIFNDLPKRNLFKSGNHNDRNLPNDDSLLCNTENLSNGTDLNKGFVFEIKKKKLNNKNHINSKDVCQEKLRTSTSNFNTNPSSVDNNVNNVNFGAPTSKMLPINLKTSTKEIFPVNFEATTSKTLPVIQRDIDTPISEDLRSLNTPKNCKNPVTITEEFSYKSSNETNQLSIKSYNNFTSKSIDSYKQFNLPVKNSTPKIKNVGNFKTTREQIVRKDSNENNNKSTINGTNLIDPAQLANKLLQTPISNSHLILPYLTSSSRKSTSFNTPITVNNVQIQSLLPLDSFIDNSGRHNSVNRCASSTGPQPHTTPSDKLRTPRTIQGSLESNHHTILAITEGRGLARGEVGIAVMDIKRPSLILCQISDAQTYVNTLTKVNFFQPTEILIPNTFAENQNLIPLFSLLNDNFPYASLTSVQRRHFNDKIGLTQIQSLCLAEYSSVELILKHKFYALSAAAALIKYVEFRQTVLFCKSSIKVEFQSAEDIMSIDMESAKQLELVLSNSGGGSERSLLGVLNHCTTVSGRRYLRSNILQPPYNQKVTEIRLQSVTELVEDPTLIGSLKKELLNFVDVEQLLWLCMQLPNINAFHKSSETQMNFILLLKSSLDSLPGLIETLKDTKSLYFRKALQVLKDDRYEFILDIINKSINADAKMVKGFMASQHQRCFAIKPKLNGLLDVARCTYSNLIEKTHENVLKLSSEYGLPLKLSSTSSKGMHVQLNTFQNRSFKIKDLPNIFIQVNRAGKSLITCTTEEILILNQRMKHALREIELMSNAIVINILQEIRQHIGCLYKLSEVIAKLDILLSFALISSSSDFVKPTFGNELKLKASRHPILDFINSSRPVGNDVNATLTENFHIITGPNMGGKSIYIRQVALLQIMAQIGCYVPAESAVFCPVRNIFTRIGFDDSIESNASTFKLEMLQMKYILQSATVTHRSLIIIDELCRGTCSEEGTAIAWALCLELAVLKSFTFFTTHFHFLTQLENILPNIKNWHFEMVEGVNGRIKYTHKLLTGVTNNTNYGIQLAKVTSLPDSIIKLIEETKDEIVLMKQKIPNENNEDRGMSSIANEEQDVLKLLARKIINLIDNNEPITVIKDGIEFFILNELSGIVNYNNRSVSEQSPSIMNYNSNKICDNENNDNYSNNESNNSNGNMQTNDGQQEEKDDPEEEVIVITEMTVENISKDTQHDNDCHYNTNRNKNLELCYHTNSDNDNVVSKENNSESNRLKTTTNSNDSIEMKLEEMDILCNNYKDNNNNDDDMSANKPDSNKITTQECHYMLQDNNMSMENNSDNAVKDVNN